MKKNRFPSVRGVAFMGLVCAVLSLAGLALAGAQIEKKPVAIQPNLSRLTKTFTLTVDRGKGVIGSPAGGVSTLADGATISYNYTSALNTLPLMVKVDGAKAAHSGTIIMNANHKLEAFVDTVRKYRLKVMETYYQNDIPCHAGTGVCRHEGTPACGEAKFAAGTVISYDLWQNWGQIAGVYLAAYPPVAGCPPSLRDLGGMAPGEHLTGSFVMDRDYTLVISINIE